MKRYIYCLLVSQSLSQLVFKTRETKEEEQQRINEQQYVNDMLQMEADMVATYSTNEELIQEDQEHHDSFEQDEAGPFDGDKFRSQLAEEVQHFVSIYQKNLPRKFRVRYMKTIRKAVEKEINSFLKKKAMQDLSDIEFTTLKNYFITQFFISNEEWIAQEIELYIRSFKSFNEKESLAFLTKKYLELALYNGDKKKKFNDKFAKSAGTDFMVISYDYGMDLSDELVKYGEDEVKKTMKDWEGQHTPQSILLRLKNLKRQQDNQVIHDPAVDEDNQPGVEKDTGIDIDYGDGDVEEVDDADDADKPDQIAPIVSLEDIEKQLEELRIRIEQHMIDIDDFFKIDLEKV